MSYPTIFLIDAALGTIFVFILPFLKPREKSDMAPEIEATGPEVVK